ncbi:phage baseplate upper protein [Leuconostoc citreum]
MANQDLVFDITKNLALQIPQQQLWGRVGDGGLKAVTVLVQQNNRNYNLTGLTPIFEGVKSDDTHIIDNAGGVLLDPQGGVFRFVFHKQAFTAEGEYKQAFFKLMRGDQVDTTIEFKITVLKNMVEIGINSADYISDFEQIKQKISDDYTQFVQEQGAKNDALSAAQGAISAKNDQLSSNLATIENNIKGQDIVTNSQLDSKLSALGNGVFIDESNKKLV